MTAREFVEEIGRVSSLFSWKLLPDTGKHASRRRQVRLKIRASSEAARRESLNPLNALYFVRTGRLLADSAWPEAAEELDLPPKAAAELISAADDRTWTGPEGERVRMPDLESLRFAMMEAVGLRVGPQTAGERPRRRA